MRNKLFAIIILISILVIFCGCAKRSLPSFEERVALENPEDGDIKNLSIIFFDWEIYPEANNYKILLWHEDSLIWERIESGSSVKSSLPLKDGSYTWCVGVRIGEDDFDNWSDTLSFTINQRPFEVKSNTETPGLAHDCFPVENWLYVADGQSGLTIVNIEDILDISFVSNIDWYLQYDARGLCADAEINILAIADYRGEPPVYIFNITDRAEPVQIPVSSYPRLTDDVFGFWMRDTFFLLAADDDDGMYLFDFGTPGYIIQRGDPYGTEAFLRGVVAWDTIAAVAIEDAGVDIINIANPDNKIHIGSCDTPGEATRLRYYDGYLYVADGIAGLAVIDVGDPANPERVYQSDTQVGEAQDIEFATLDGTDYLALAIGSDGVLFYCLDNPASPELIHQLETPYAYGIGADNRAFYIADRDWGVVVTALE